MAWPDDGTFADFARRYPFTIASADLTGSGTITDFLCPVDLGQITDLSDHVKGNGFDIAFANAAGTAKIKHELIPESQWVRRAAAGYIWFGNRQALKVPSHGTSGAMYYCSVVGNVQIVTKFDIDTGVLTHETLTESGDEEKDDHNQPSLALLSTGALVAVYSTHTASNNLKYKVTSSTTGDISTFGSESSVNPSGGGTPKYTYFTIFELSGLTGGAKIVCVYRTGINDWAMITSDTDAISWSSETVIWNTGSQSPYIRAVQNGTTRIDFLASQGHPETVSPGNEMYHFYYDDGTFYNSAGTSRSTPLGDSGDTNPATLIVDPGLDNAWIEDIGINASGNPVCLVTYFPSDVASNQDLYAYTWSGSAWSGVKIADSGTGPEGSGADPNYTGGAVFIPDSDATKIYAGVEVSSVYEIQRWENDSGWSKTADITAGSSDHQFRPMVAEGSTEGEKGALIWMAGDYPAFNTFQTGIRAYPAFDSYYKRAMVHIASLDLDSDNTGFLYCKNAAAANQQDLRGAYPSRFKCVARASEPLTIADSYGAGDSTGNCTITYDGPTEGVSTIHADSGESFDIDTGGDHIEIVSGLDFSGETDFVTMMWAQPDLSNGSADKNLFNSWVGPLRGDILARIEAGGDYEVFTYIQTNTQIGGNAVTGVADDTWNLFGAGYRTGTGSIGRVGKTEGTSNATTGGAFDADSSHSMHVGSAAAGSGQIKGPWNEFWAVTDMSKDEHDTLVDAWTTGIMTFGAADTGAGGGVTVPIFAHHYNQMRTA